MIYRNTERKTVQGFGGASVGKEFVIICNMHFCFQYIVQYIHVTYLYSCITGRVLIALHIQRLVVACSLVADEMYLIVDEM